MNIAERVLEAERVFDRAGFFRKCGDRIGHKRRLERFAIGEGLEKRDRFDRFDKGFDDFGLLASDRR